MNQTAFPCGIHAPATAKLLQVVAAAVHAHGGEGVDVVVAALELNGRVRAVHARNLDGLDGVFAVDEGG